MSEILLCADSMAVRHPESLGLDGESLESQDWMEVLSSAHEARIRVRQDEPQEVWVAGSDEVDPINLAAALKRDGGAGKVCLLAFSGGGSQLSRAKAACIDEVWDKHAFLARYQRAKGGSAPASAMASSTGAEGAGAELSASSTAEAGYLLSVVGAGGGVGKSSVAVVAAYIAQARGYRTALVDADLQFGDVSYLTGCESALPCDEALVSDPRLDALDCHGRHPAVVSAPVRLEHAEEVASQIPFLVARLRQRFDVVVVNTSPAWDDVHLNLLEAGGNALFLLDQRPSSIRSCKHALQLCARCGVPTQPIVFALNRCSRQSLFSSIDVTCALQGAHVVELSEGGRDVEELLGTGAPVELVDSGNALCQSVGRVLDDLLPAQAGPEGAAPQIRMPSKRRMWFAPRRKKAACL